MFDIITLNDMLVSELKEVATKLDINSKGLKKQDLIYKILEEQAVKTPATPDEPVKTNNPKRVRNHVRNKNKTDQRNLKRQITRTHLKETQKIDLRINETTKENEDLVILSQTSLTILTTQNNGTQTILPSLKKAINQKTIVQIKDRKP